MVPFVFPVLTLVFLLPGGLSMAPLQKNNGHV